VQNPLSTFPVVSGGKVYVNRGNEEILALDLASGRPAWGQSATVFEQELEDDRAKDPRLAATLGVPRFTATVFGERLYARMGTPLTSRPRDASQSTDEGYLICLDLAGQGRLAWKITPEPGWAFEGSPVADANNVYVAMRRNEVQPQSHVACYAVETGQVRWRQFVCAADTPARGGLPEITHNLLTLHRNTLYLNTNLGAVACISTWNGSLRWVSTYPRTLKGDLAKPPAHACRDLPPCVYDRGAVYVAPAHTRSIFALDAASGQILWQSGPELEDAIHLLGVSHDCLIASGSRLYWIHLSGPEQGRLKHVWPDGAAKPGYGHGLLAGDCVLWPTREKIYQFDQASGRLQKAIELKARGVRGGNLVVAGGRLLIATPEELVALGEPAVPTKPEPPAIVEPMRRTVEPPRSHALRGNARSAALRREPAGTQSVPSRVPTQSVGTRDPSRGLLIRNPEP
jgi:outer membrane protein assembly factor BamB